MRSILSQVAPRPIEGIINQLCDVNRVPDAEALPYERCAPDHDGQRIADALKNMDFKERGTKLMGELLPFYVNRKPGRPVV
jgi:hypothetical protein